ncbi:protein CrdC [Myxococcus sp. AM009]|uniref:protein CrdC n=1 Tax=unclassified Myxococcus TaxID=2648731 RepID=UPI0015954B9D|nr:MULTISPECIES: protein CrdC [unclassified Myxococcus]NVJ02913.1 protein CrdC [Myxococcus sp. AM009]NVJ19360.1 protein CrdC [Myxococcus sp. AM010]
MEPPGHVRGMLLCHAGPHRLAFHAHEVASIASPSGHAAASARRAFHEAAGAARVLVSASGGAVGVDALEIDAESHRVLSAPPVTVRASGGSLQGFVLARGELWPLVGLADFERFLRGHPGEGA